MMARKRMIDPEFWSDEEVGHWSPHARLFYIGLWSFSDDDGRLKAHDSLLKSQIFPYDDKVDIGSLKKEIGSKISWYDVGGLKYGYVRNFLKYQRIEKPRESCLPSPPEEGTLLDSSRNALGKVEPKRREEKGREGTHARPLLELTNGVFNSWNCILPHKVRSLTHSRKKHILARLKEPLFAENYDLIFRKVLASDFLMGKVPSEKHKDWKATFDWVISNDHNYVKVFEGNYDNKKSRGDL